MRLHQKLKCDRKKWWVGENKPGVDFNFSDFSVPPCICWRGFKETTESTVFSQVLDLATYYTTSLTPDEWFNAAARSLKGWSQCFVLSLFNHIFTEHCRWTLIHSLTPQRRKKNWVHGNLRGWPWDEWDQAPSFLETRFTSLVSSSHL